MYEINLVPDVKAELLNKQKLRNLVILICIIVAIACGAVIVILLGFTGTQALILNELDTEAICRTTGPNRDVSKCDSKYGTAILKYENFEELLTIQDQMHNITLLNNEKIKMSRLFPILDVILPTGENTVKISAAADAVDSGADGKQARAFGAGLGRKLGGKNGPKRLGLKRISGKRCGAFSENDVIGRLSAAEIVIVHARKVIVNE